MGLARIADRTWICDCCGMENDQRGCVKGPPRCLCYSARVAGRFSASPSFCIICERCQLHCPGSQVYHEPKDDYLYKYLNDDAPIRKEVKPHTFVRFGLCDCESVDEDTLVPDVKVRDDLRPRRIHLTCGRWKLDDPT